jgi:hypothetical protein
LEAFYEGFQKKNPGKFIDTKAICKGSLANNNLLLTLDGQARFDPVFIALIFLFFFTIETDEI